MSSINITPYSSMGGTRIEQSLTELAAQARSPHYKWVEKLRTSLDFVTADNTLICVADSPFAEFVDKVTPIGLTQSFDASESLPVALVPEVGSRRKRAMVGSSAGGGINISKMVTAGMSPERTIFKYGETLGIDASKKFWSEAEWLALSGMNHDLFRNPIGIIVIEATPDGRNYRIRMFEQCLMQGSSTGYQASGHVVVSNMQFVYEQEVPLWNSEETSLGSGGTV